MQQGLRWAGLFVMACAFVLPVIGADEKKTDAKPEVKEKHLPVGQPFLAKVVKVENGQRLFVKVQSFNGKSVDWKDANYEIAEKAPVRMESAPLAFDDKGKIKKYTAQELKELKGPDPQLWGYAGDLDTLKADQMIRVFLGKKKSSPKADPPLVTMIHVAGAKE